MRTPNIGSTQFIIGDPAEFSNVQDLARYVRDLEQRVARAFLALGDGHLDKVYGPPVKPRDGDYRYADGTIWNPGSGPGFYRYNGTTWVFLG